jgi:hypothetical protein
MDSFHRLAFHEAGHCTVSHRLGLPLRAVCVRRDEGLTLTDVARSAIEPGVGGDYKRIASLAAGSLAQALAEGRERAGDADDDCQKIARIAALHELERRLAGDRRPRQSADRALERGLACAELILRCEWGAVLQLVRWLSQAPALDAEAVATAIALAPPRCLLAPTVHLRALAARAGDDAYLLNSPALRRLIRAAEDAAWWADFRAAERETEQYYLAQVARRNVKAPALPYPTRAWQRTQAAPLARRR